MTSSWDIDMPVPSTLHRVGPVGDDAGSEGAEWLWPSFDQSGRLVLEPGEQVHHRRSCTLLS